MAVHGDFHVFIQAGANPLVDFSIHFDIEKAETMGAKVGKEQHFKCKTRWAAYNPKKSLYSVCKYAFAVCC